MLYVDDLSQVAPEAYRDRQARKVGERNGHLWCHLTADDEEELHGAAARIGMKRSWFQGTHYDLTPSRRVAAVTLGAIQVTKKQLCRKVMALMRASKAQENKALSKEVG